MAERKSGPVKPPVIDLTARPAEPGKPAAAESGKPASTAAGTRQADKTAAPKAAPDARPAATAPVQPESRPIEAKPVEADAAEAKPADAKPADAGPSDAGPAEPAKPAAPAAPAVAPRRGSSWGAGIGGAIGGTVAATAICYGLAVAGFWPSSTADLDARMTALQAGLQQNQKDTAANASALTDVSGHLTSMGSDAAARLAAAADGVAKLQQSVAQLQAAKPATSDLAPLEAEVKALSSRLDAVAAGASSADAGAIAANLATLQQTVSGLADKLQALETHGTATDAALTGLKDQLAAAKSAIDQAAAAPSPKAIASAMQLPLLISALEADFTAGRPYADDLGKLKAAVPEARIPAAVTDFAAAGLPAPGELTQRLEAVMPDMLGVRPPSTDSSWQGQAMDWFKGVMAIRPQGEQSGNGPDAVLSQLSAAVDRHDFAGAAKLLGQLPAPMQQAAGDVAAQIRALADADGFIAGLRTSALAPAAGGAN